MPATADADDSAGRLVLLQVETVRVHPQKPGEAGFWDAAQKEADSDALCELVGLGASALLAPAAGIAAGAFCGASSTGSAQERDARAPDLLVAVTVGNNSYASYVARDTCAHVFSYPVLLDLANVPSTGVQVAVWDLDRDAMSTGTIGELLGQARFSSDQLSDISRRAMPIESLHEGSVDKLEMVVRAVKPNPRTATFQHAAGQRGLTTTQLTVIAGEELVLRARGQYTVSSWANKLIGPQGYPGVEKRSYNLREFPNTPHGAAIAQIVGAQSSTANIPVGACVRLIAPASGAIAVGVNDHGTSNNRGTLTFDVSVAAPPPGGNARPGQLLSCDASPPSLATQPKPDQEANTAGQRPAPPQAMSPGERQARLGRCGSRSSWSGHAHLRIRVDSAGTVVDVRPRTPNLPTALRQCLIHAGKGLVYPAGAVTINEAVRITGRRSR